MLVFKLNQLTGRVVISSRLMCNLCSIFCISWYRLSLRLCAVCAIYQGKILNISIAPVAAVMVNLYGCRRIGLLGGFLSSVGIVQQCLLYDRDAGSDHRSVTWTAPYLQLCRADSRFVHNQWETALLCNDVSHWLGTRLGSAQLWYKLRFNVVLSSVAVDW